MDAAFDAPKSAIEEVAGNARRQSGLNLNRDRERLADGFALLKPVPEPRAETVPHSRDFPIDSAARPDRADASLKPALIGITESVAVFVFFVFLFPFGRQ